MSFDKPLLIFLHIILSLSRFSYFDFSVYSLFLVVDGEGKEFTKRTVGSDFRAENPD